MTIVNARFFDVCDNCIELRGTIPWLHGRIGPQYPIELELAPGLWVAGRFTASDIDGETWITFDTIRAGELEGR